MAATVSALRTGKLYTIAEAAHLAGGTPQNARRWLLGYASEGHRMAPVFARRDGDARLSFVEMIELVVVTRFRQGATGVRIPLERLRVAHRFARAHLGIDYPFASEQLRYEGGHIMHKFETSVPGPGKLAIDMHGNYALPSAVEETLNAFDYDTLDHLALRWLMDGRGGLIVIDPRFGAGRPVVAGSNVRVEIIKARFEAGEDVDELAEDFQLDSHAVQAALRVA